MRGARAVGDFEFVGEWVLCCEDGGGGGRGEVCGGVGVLVSASGLLISHVCIDGLDRSYPSGLESDVTIYFK